METFYLEKVLKVSLTITILGLICPSAKAGISIPILVHAFCDSHFYEKDYMDITGYFTMDYVAYDETIRVICELVDDGYFDE